MAKYNKPEEKTLNDQSDEKCMIGLEWVWLHCPWEICIIPFAWLEKTDVKNLSIFTKFLKSIGATTS